MGSQLQFLHPWVLRSRSFAHLVFSFHLRASQQIYRSKVIEYNCASSKIFLPILFQIPIWIFTTAAIRNLAYQRTDPGSAESLQRILELSTEGCLWFPNLVIKKLLLLTALEIIFPYSLSCYPLSSHQTLMPPISALTGSFDWGLVTRWAQLLITSLTINYPAH